MNDKHSADDVHRPDIAQPLVARPVHVVQGDSQFVHTESDRHSSLLDDSRHSKSEYFDRSALDGAAAPGALLQRSTTAPERLLAADQVSGGDLSRAPSEPGSAPQLPHHISVVNSDVPAGDVRSASSQSRAEQYTAQADAQGSLIQHANSRQQSHSQQVSDINRGTGIKSSQRVHQQSHSSSSSSLGPLQSEVEAQAVGASLSGAEQQQVSGLLLAGETVVPTPAPVAADSVISAAVESQEQDALKGVGIAADLQPLQQQTTLVNAGASDHTAEDSSGHRDAARQKAPTATTERLGDGNASSSSMRSSRSPSLPLPALLALGFTAAAAVAGAVVFWVKRRGSAPAAAEADDEFTRALKEMEAEEKAFDKEAAIDDDPGAELSAEEAALALQQADAARKEKMIAAALAEGDAELAKIDALESAELDNLDPDELAALEAELAELEGEKLMHLLGQWHNAPAGDAYSSGLQAEPQRNFIDSTSEFGFYWY